MKSTEINRYNGCNICTFVVIVIITIISQEPKVGEVKRANYAAYKAKPLSDSHRKSSCLAAVSV
jgi:hypothetical protein